MKIIFRILFLLMFAIVLTTIIAYARGYRFDLENRSLKSTGIIAATSNPKAAKIYVNGELKGVTDTNLTLPPDNYLIEIKKEGYTGWNKKINLKGELVINVDPVLFPVNPSLSPLTNLGIIKAIPTDDGDKIVLIASGSAYLFDAGKKTLPFFPPLNKIVDLSLLPNIIDFNEVKVTFSPDQKQAIFETEQNSYLLSLEEINLNPLEVTLSKEALFEAWQNEKNKNTIKILETFPKDFDKIASSSFEIISFSPNETKVLYKAKNNTELPLMINPPLISTNQTLEERSIMKDVIYVYDRKEDKNFPVLQPNLKWYYDSRHFVVEEEKKISIVDYDDTNKQTIYSGPFESYFFNPTSDGKIIVLTNLNSQINELPDLYLVGIR
ncbi:MAG: PEGA domain-containing protein [Candidatus Roizmanbacteria bacterium]|nr:PEGA domain-containing protein [Candidatus Roizmanbacteria bacterium]MCR4313140.1 PEGA domain-containing protein [Candidatus Roizmanbacteria bacterium]